MSKHRRLRGFVVAARLASIFILACSLITLLDASSDTAHADTKFTIRMAHWSGNGKQNAGAKNGPNTAGWRSQLNSTIAARKLNLMTVTEADATGTAAVKSLRGMDAFVAPNNSGFNDTAIIWSKADWVRVYTGSHKITTLASGGARGNPQYANFAILRNKATNKKVLVTASHLPHNDTEAHREMWKNAVKGWNKKRNELAQKYDVDAQIEAADYNRNINQSDIRQLMNNSIPDMKHAWPPRGTWGRSTIDHAYYKGDITLSSGPNMIPKVPSFSDHQGFSMNFTLSGSGSSSSGSKDSNPKTPPPPPSCSTAVLDKMLCGGQGISGLLLLIINILATGIGLVAVGGMIWASILWATAEESVEQVHKAKVMMTNIVIGLVSFALFWGFLQFIIPGGLGRPVDGLQKTETAAHNQKLKDEQETKKAADDKKKSSSSSTAKPTTVAIKNFRDAAASTSGVLKPGVLYRSVDLSSANVSVEKAKKLGAILGSDSTIIDLRLPNDSHGSDRAIPGATVARVPTIGFTDMTNDVTRSDTMKDFAKALRIAAKTKGSVLVHCHNGKDRTGWMIALIMSINGASEDQLIKEYMLSNHQGLTVKKVWLTNGINKVRSKYGSIKNYVKKGLGLSDTEIKALQKKFGA